MKRLGKEIPNLEYEIYGKGGSTGLLKRIIELTGADWISLEGFEPAKNVLKKARVFVQTSLSENMSLSCLEALASGVPVVCSDIRGHPDSASKVSHESMKKVADEIEKLLTDDEYWEAKREEGLAEAREYDVGSVIPSYEKLFASLIDGLSDFKRKSRMLEVEP